MKPSQISVSRTHVISRHKHRVHTSSRDHALKILIPDWKPKANTCRTRDGDGTFPTRTKGISEFDNIDAHFHPGPMTVESCLWHEKQGSDRLG